MGSSPQIKLTQAQLDRRSRRLLYELLMAENLAGILSDEPLGSGSRDELTRYMACVESLLSNLLALCCFLYPSKAERKRRSGRRATGEPVIFAADFCSEQWRAREWPGAGRVRKTIARDLDQLGAADLPGARSWEYARLLVSLKSALRSFLQGAELLSPEVRSELELLLDGGRSDIEDAQPVPSIPLLRRDAIATTDLVDGTGRLPGR